jgi:O-antigen ligase
VNISPILTIEIGIAILLILTVLSVNPEWGLFLYGLALGFPDIAISLGTAINLRLDDALIVLFLIRLLLWSPLSLMPGQKTVVKPQLLFAAACMCSALVGLARGTPPAAYESLKMIGCIVILLTLARLLQSRRRLRFLSAGLMSGGIALLFQIRQRLGSRPGNYLGTFQELKSAAAFSTWNPNTIGQAAMLLTFAAGLGWIVFRKSRINSGIWPCFATAFSLVPTMVFARSASLSIALGYLLFLGLMRRWKFALLFLMVGLALFTYRRKVDTELVDSATRVDISTGEGFSHRFERWDMALEAIRSAPVLGHGFGQEWTYLSGVGSEGRAHNAYMTVWIELGFGGLALLLVAIYQFVSSGLSLYRDLEFQACGALLLSLIATVCVDSLASSTLYWEKLPTIALSIGIALIGICERGRVRAVAQNASAAPYQAFPEHSRI